MTSRTTCILFMLFHTQLISTAYAANIENDCKENTMKCQDDESASSCQPNIKQYIEDAINTVFTRQDKSVRSLDKQIKALTATIKALERKIDDKLDRCTYNESWGGGIAMCPSGYKYYKQDKFCYKFHNECKSWSEARKVCQQEGGDLISLKESNYNFFKDMARSEAGKCINVWVGTTDIGTEGQWYWLNGERVNSSFWYPGEPNNLFESEHCGDLFLLAQYSLNDHQCHQEEHFLCQIVWNN